MKIERIMDNSLLLPNNDGKRSEGFIELVKKFIEDVNSDLSQAKEAEKQLISGNVTNLEELMYKIEKSDISLRLLVELRNKALESYHEIMRMQV